MASNLIPLFKSKSRFSFDYYFGEDGKVVGVSCQDWPFRIMRNGSKIALVCEDTDEPFGELDAEVFNTLLACWLMIDDIDTLRSAAKGL